MTNIKISFGNVNKDVLGNNDSLSNKYSALVEQYKSLKHEYDLLLGNSNTMKHEHNLIYKKLIETNNEHLLLVNEYNALKNDYKALKNKHDALKNDINSSQISEHKCIICLENIDKYETHNNISLVCGHIYHQNCITRWMHDNNYCPICKTIIKQT